MILTDPAVVADPGGFVLGEVEGALRLALGAAPYAQKFAACGGVLLTRDARESNGWLAKGAGRPFLFLEVADVQLDESTTPRRDRWLIEISIEIFTLAATAPFETPLKAAVLAILSGKRDAFSEIGIEENAARSGQGRGALPERVNPHTFTCAIHTAR